MKYSRKKDHFTSVLLLPSFIISEEKQEVNLMAIPGSDKQYYLGSHSRFINR